jgi:hypothetical protein
MLFTPGHRPFIFFVLLPAICYLHHPASAQSRGTADHERFSLEAAIGTVNGARLGVQFLPVPSYALELSAGYVRVDLLEENGRKQITNGYSATAGARWYSHPGAMISPFLSAIVIYVRTDNVVRGEAQQRLAYVPAIGSVYSFLDGYSVFFRFGPAFHFTDELGTTRYETLMQFDAGFVFRL